jgi:hypothetical protein
MQASLLCGGGGIASSWDGNAIPIDQNPAGKGSAEALAIAVAFLAQRWLPSAGATLKNRAKKNKASQRRSE